LISPDSNEQKFTESIAKSQKRNNVKEKSLSIFALLNYEDQEYDLNPE